MQLKRIAFAVGEALSWKMLEVGARYGLIACALPLQIEDKAAFEKLPEPQRALYKEDGGKWKLEVEGLEDTSALKGALENERKGRKEDMRKLKEQLKQYEGIDPEAVRGMMEHFENAEEADLLKKGADGIQKIVEKRTQRAQEAWNKEKQTLEQQMQGYQEVASTFMDQVLAFRLTEAALKAGVIPEALDDVILNGRQMFDVDDDGNAVQFEEDGETVVTGKDGKTPYSAAEWIETMKEKKPHWFAAGNSGGGAGGNRRTNGSGAKTIKRAAWEGMSQIERAQKSKEGFTVVD